MQHLIYLHGFLSSPQSQKAQQTVAYAKKHYPFLNIHVPTLPGNIHKTVKIIDSLIATLPLAQVGFVGSSMGGFLSTYALENYKQDNAKPKAVLVNPAVEPFSLLKDYLGKHINPYTGEIFYIHDCHLEKLKSIYVESINSPQAYKVLLQTGDTTLDYRLAKTKYTGSNMIVEAGGAHSFVNYSQHLPKIFEFLFTQ